jgi:hypothetical protein
VQTVSLGSGKPRYATHEKSLRGKLLWVCRDPRTREPCSWDQFTMKKKCGQYNEEGKGQRPFWTIHAGLKFYSKTEGLPKTLDLHP